MLIKVKQLKAEKEGFAPCRNYFAELPKKQETPGRLLSFLPHAFSAAKKAVLVIEKQILVNLPPHNTARQVALV